MPLKSLLNSPIQPPKIRMKILAVDDKPENLFALKKLLHQVNAEVITASSGQEALGFMIRHVFALALLDVNMPEMNGIELAELIRETENGKSLPLIFITANDPNYSQEFQGYEQGAVDYLFKPIDGFVLTSKVKVFLELQERKEILLWTIRQLNRKKEELKAFARIVSHDLKNPLASMKLGISILRDRAKKAGGDEKLTGMLEMLEKSSDWMQRLIEDILHYSVTEEATIHKEPLDPAEIIDQTQITLAQILAESAGAVSRGTLHPIRGARTLVLQLFQNLVANSLKFRNPSIAPVVVIDSKKGQNGSGMSGVHYFVQDNGRGFERGDGKNLFIPFKRLGNAVGTPGTGLGLANCHNIMEKHGGSIEAESEGVGKGARVTLFFPD